LIAGLAGVGGGDAVGADEVGDAGEKKDQQADDDGQRALSGFDGWLPEGAHAVADGFDAGHRGAAVREHLQQQRKTDDSGCRRQRSRRRDNRCGMSAGEDRV